MKIKKISRNNKKKNKEMKMSRIEKNLINYKKKK